MHHICISTQLVVIWFSHRNCRTLFNTYIIRQYVFPDYPHTLQLCISNSLTLTLVYISFVKDVTSEKSDCTLNWSQCNRSNKDGYLAKLEEIQCKLKQSTEVRNNDFSFLFIYLSINFCP